MTAAAFPPPFITRGLHHRYPGFFDAVFQPVFDALPEVLRLMETFRNAGVRFPTPLEEECARATQSYFQQHADNFATPRDELARAGGKPR